MEIASKTPLAAKPLFDREHEVATIDEKIESAGAGTGGFLVVEGPAGTGKTRLVEEARSRASAAGLRVLQARGGELERYSPFGVARQLFEPALFGAARSRPETLLRGAAQMAAPLFHLDQDGALEDRPLAGEGLFATLHGLYWLSANLAKRAPHLFLIDDAQWADTSSLRWLAYMARRVDDLPVLVAVAMRPNEHDESESGHLLSVLSADHSATVLQPSRLSQPAVTAMVSTELSSDPDPVFCETCLRVTAGNPLFLTHLLGALQGDSIEPTETAAQSLRDVVPETVVRAVAQHLTTMPSTAFSLARAVAVFGGGVELRFAASLAGLDLDAAQDAADLLASDEILKPERPLDFVHPIVRQAIYARLPTRLRTQHHTTAARMLIADGAAPERSAAHLLHAEPGANAWVVDALRAAGRKALIRGAPDAAETYLERALSEPPEAAQRAGLLWALGSAKVQAREPDAAEYLTNALEASDDPVERGRIAGDLGRLLTLSGQADEAIDRLEPLLEEFERTDPKVGARLAIDLGVAAWAATPPRPELVEQLAERYWQKAAEGDDRTPLVAHCAFAAYAAGAPADFAAMHAENAVGAGGFLAEDNMDAPAFQFALNVLTLTDRFELAGRLCDEALAEAQARGSVSGVAAVSCWRSRNNLFCGAIADAEADARVSLAVASEPGGWELGLPVSLAFLIDALIERDDLDGAEEALEQAGVGKELPECLMCHPLLFSRGRLRILQDRYDEGLDDLFMCGRWQERWPIKAPGMAPWRTAAATVLAARGEREEARRLAAEELDQAKAFGAPRALAAALRTAGLVERGARGVERLREAVEVLEDSPARLEKARVLTDLGALLRRTGRRREARDKLRAGLDSAYRCGMVALTKRARDELVAAGARPRRAALSGVDALTPSELRVAKLAAQGLSNPSIAQQLFVTLRTVEMHLTNAYGKLGIGSRTDLAGVLGSAISGSNGDDQALTEPAESGTKTE